MKVRAGGKSAHLNACTPGRTWILEVPTAATDRLDGGFRHGQCRLDGGGALAMEQEAVDGGDPEIEQEAADADVVLYQHPPCCPTTILFVPQPPPAVLQRRGQPPPLCATRPLPPIQPADHGAADYSRRSGPGRPKRAEHKPQLGSPPAAHRCCVLPNARRPHD